MHRFVTVMWNPHDERAAKRAGRLRQKLLSAEAPWERVVDDRGLFAVHQPSIAGTHAYVLPRRGGVIFGTLFTSPTRSESKVVETLPDRLSASDLVSGSTTSFSSEYWGQYAAVLRHNDGRDLCAVRDCSGKIPCLICDHDGVRICASDFGDAFSFGILPTLSINWEFLATYFFCAEPRTAGNGYNEVTQLLAGEASELSNGVERRWFVWDPRRLVKSEYDCSYEEAKASLRTLTQRCIDAHALTDRSVLLRLSGGFDSSVVLGCLTNSPTHPDIACVTRYATGPEEDERRYARLAAERAHVALVESKWEDSNVDLDSRLFLAPLTARPSLQLLTVGEPIWISALAERSGARSVWTGEGGDHLFIRGLNVPFAADFKHARGLKPELVRIIADNARYSRISFWDSVRRTFSLDDSSAHRHDDKIEAPPFLNSELVGADVQYSALHPWCKDLSEVPPGKQWQIREFSDLLNRGVVLVNTRTPTNSPLISQPLIETCIQIPTYYHLRGGRHRALARDAFSDLVHPEILRRDSKGTTTSFVARIFAQRRNYVRELLLDGVLAHRQIVARSAVDLATTPGKPLKPSHLFPLMSALACELWARQAESIDHSVKSAASL